MKPYPEMPPGLTLARDGEVLKLSFDRPARRNSLTDPIVYALTDTMDAAASDESVRVIHLQGEGDHFCSGFDLAERTPGPERPRVGSVHRRMNSHVNRLRRKPKLPPSPRVLLSGSAVVQPLRA